MSVIIPVYNEQQCFPALFQLLESQQGIRLQLIFSDGGSTDASFRLLEDYQQASHHQVILVAGLPGRGRQLNGGAAQATANILLFLHADSSWQGRDFLANAVADFFRQRQRQGGLVAGHFPLRFDCSARVYRYLAAKAKLNCSGTVFGDQGMLLMRTDWCQLGGFDEQLPVLEDVALAEKVWQRGTWLLLPGELETSHRRYRQDGVLRRLVDNALLLLVHGAGERSLLPPFLAGYVSPGDTAGLRAGWGEFFRRLHRLPLLRYLDFWYGCASTLVRYVWLIPYALGWLIGGEVVAGFLLSLYRPRLEKWIQSRPFALTLSLLCWLFFYLFCLFRSDCGNGQLAPLMTPEDQRRRS
ncbi:MAG: glycosyltransferase [Desulfuromonadaceae bacterium]|nr:glycosyltransferase [Desulfuromonadaceae bacterium]